MEIKSVERNGDGIFVEFKHNNKNGTFEYGFVGGEQETGIISCDYDEDDEDIYEEIHKWVMEHTSCNVIIKYDGKELK